MIDKPRDISKRIVQDLVTLREALSEADRPRDVKLVSEALMVIQIVHNRLTAEEYDASCNDPTVG